KLAFSLNNFEVKCHCKDDVKTGVELWIFTDPGIFVRSYLASPSSKPCP
ncbi:unnamed protein product, partial [Allacma fusca]